MIPAAVILSIGVSVGILFVGSIVPAPAYWNQDPTDDVHDLKVSVGLKSGAFGGDWEIVSHEVTSQKSRLVNLEAWFRNLLELGTASQTVVFRLEAADDASQVVQVRTDRTGAGAILGSTASVGVVLREIPIGDYVLRLQVVNDANQVVDEEAVPLHIRGAA